MTAEPPRLEYRPRLVDGLLDEYAEQLSALTVVGPRASGKTTTVRRRAASVIRLDAPGEAAAFRADADAALRGLDEPVLLDEWQAVPDVLAAVRRSVENDPRPNRFYLTGSVIAAMDVDVWAGTGRAQTLTMYPMTVREQAGGVAAPTFFDRLADRRELTVPTATPDLAGYVDLALSSGFPLAALLLSGRSHRAWLDSYLDDLLTRDVATLSTSRGRQTDSRRLRRYFNAYALNSAGEADHKSIYEAAGINRMTALAYDELLMRLFAVEELDAWATNRLKRVRSSPKRYVVESALIAAALRLDARGILSDGDLLGRVLDTFVVAQLRPEVLLSESQPRLHHVRTQSSREEIDIVAELGGGRVIGIEVKADNGPGHEAAKHLKWMRDRIGERFVAGVVLHTGPRRYELDDRILAAPISSIWG
jgi:uncharacterized protein